jgi:predicted DCC family thiol-disulfide oxidoreductase YuxK
LKTEGPVVLYDADCGFCRWSLAKLLRWDRRRRLRPVEIESVEGARLLANLSPQERLSSWHFVATDGGRESGGTAVAPQHRQLPFGHLPAALVDRFPATTERAYGLIVRNRGTLGRLVSAGAIRRADARIKRHSDDA